jgi:hypothetical protein
VLGLTVLKGGVSLSLLAGVALSNLRRQDQEPAQSVDATSGTRAKHAGVPRRRIRAGELRVRTFSTNSRPALRPGNDTTATGNQPHPTAHQACRRWLLETW